MPVSKGQTTGVAMIARRIIYDLRGGHVGKAVHFHHKISVIDAVLALIQQHKRIGGGGENQFKKIAIKLPPPRAAPKKPGNGAPRIPLSPPPPAPRHDSGPRPP